MQVCRCTAPGLCLLSRLRKAAAQQHTWGERGIRGTSQAVMEQIMKIDRSKKDAPKGVFLHARLVFF